MSSCHYDVVVIGAGPGGYKCAIKAAKLGLSVACVDENSKCGGTCLRVGCIPSKALLEYSYSYYAAKNHFPRFGVTARDISFNLGTMFEVRDKEVALLSAGIESLFSSAGVRRFQGTAKVRGRRNGFFEVSICMHDGSVENIGAKNVVLATGSEPSGLPGIAVDGTSVIFSDAALNMEVPKRLLVIGGGAIGLEMSSIWSRLGAEVTVIEYSDRIAAGFDGEVSKALLGYLKKQGINFCLSHRVVAVERKKSCVMAKCESVSGGVSSIDADVVLVAVGRKPNLRDTVELDGLLLDDRGFVRVDERLETGIRGVYAIGDVIGGAMLAHKAEVEGHAVAEMLAGGSARVDYGVIPSVIYTHPAASSVGRSEEYLKGVGHGYKVGRSNFAANGRARVSCDTDGFVKVIACKETDVILGVHIVGACADTMINEAAVALGYRATARDICHVCHSHPDVNEVFRDACEIACHKR